MLQTYRLCQHPSNPHGHAIPLSIVYTQILSIFGEPVLSVATLWHALLGIIYSFSLNGFSLLPEINWVLKMIDNILKTFFVLYIWYLYVKIPFVCLRSFYLTWRMSKEEKDAIYAQMT